MEMIRTFRITATEKDTHAIRDYKYTESCTITGTTASIAYYDDEFTTLSTDTIDLVQYEIHGCPNKTSRKGIYYKKRPLPSIASLLPLVAAYKYVPITIPVHIPLGQIDIAKPMIATSKAGIHQASVTVPAVSVVQPTISVAHL